MIRQIVLFDSPRAVTCQNLPPQVFKNLVFPNIRQCIGFAHGTAYLDRFLRHEAFEETLIFFSGCFDISSELLFNRCKLFTFD